MNSKKRTILYVITKSNWGGAQKYVADVAVHVHTRGAFGAAVACGRSEVNSDDTFRRTLAKAGIPVFDLPRSQRNISPINDIATLVRLFRICRRVRPDTVHLNSSKAAGVGALAARLAGVPNIVYTVHGLPFLESRPAWQNALIKAATYATFLIVNRIIVVSQRELKRVRRWPLVGRKIVHIYNGVSETDFLPREEARKVLQEKYGVHFGAGPVIGSIAEMTRNKGLAYALEALAELKQNGHSFTFVHFGDGELRAPLARRAQNLHLEEHMHWLGFVENAAAYLKAFDIFVLPSVKEGMPYAVLEAGLAELPVVATDVGGVSEILDNERGIIVPSEAPAALRRALVTLLTDEYTRARLGSRLGAHVRNTFSRESMLAHTEAQYVYEK